MRVVGGIPHGFMPLKSLVFSVLFLFVVCAAATTRALDVPPAVPVINVEIEQLEPVTPSAKTPENSENPAEAKAAELPASEVKTKNIVVPDVKPEETKQVNKDNLPKNEQTPTSESQDNNQKNNQGNNIAQNNEQPEPKMKAKRPPVVVELFSSQACVFCPKADEFLARLSTQENIITLSCHVDYFDVKTGSLSHPFCSARQAGYESTLRGGPKYTPQMVINGKYDAVGYQRKQVLKTIIRARKEKPLITPQLEQDQGAKTFTLTLPQQDDRMSKTERTKQGWETKTPALSDAAMKIYLLVFDKPRSLVVADGGNKGKQMTYYNVVSNVGMLGGWNGDPRKLRFDPKLKPGSGGFAVLIHDNANGVIVGAAQYIRP